MTLLGRQCIQASPVGAGKRRPDIELIADRRATRALRHGRREVGAVRREEGDRRRRVNALQAKVRYAGGVDREPLRVAHAEDSGDALGPEAPGREEDRVTRTRVEPVQVVHDADHRARIADE